MTIVAESIKESLIGTTQEPQLSQETRASFLKHAKTDENGEYYMEEPEFIDAVAPAGEDYVSFDRISLCSLTTAQRETSSSCLTCFDSTK